jgi:hypothetical protein
MRLQNQNLQVYHVVNKRYSDMKKKIFLNDQSVIMNTVIHSFIDYEGKSD